MLKNEHFINKGKISICYEIMLSILAKITLGNTDFRLKRRQTTL